MKSTLLLLLFFIITFNIVNLVYLNLLKLAKMKLTCNLIYLADYFFVKIFVKMYPLVFHKFFSHSLP